MPECAKQKNQEHTYKLHELKIYARHEQIARWHDKALENKLRRSDFEQMKLKNAERQLRISIWKEGRSAKLKTLLTAEHDA